MATFYLPGSGPVTQDINPWSWFTSVGNLQTGFININMGKSANPALERQILDDVGSYGRQIGQLGDALDAVLQHLEADGWQPQAQAKEAVDAFRWQLTEIKRIKRSKG